MTLPTAHWASRALGAALGGGAARAAYAVLTRDRAVAGHWERRNHRGESVTLLEGPAFAIAAAVALGLAPGVPMRLRAAGIVAALGCGALGAYDDLAGSGDARGLRGHLQALRRGEVTTGAIKVLGIGTTGVLAAALAGRPTASSRERGVTAIFHVALGGAVVASLANLVNLFDLRPGRAIKVGLLLGVPAMVQPGPSGAAAAVPVGAAVALLPEDLGERAMLGDAGANALGALVGVAVLARYDRIGRIVHVLIVTALTLASERVSFTRIIERTSVLRWFDALGRRPAPPFESSA